MKCRLQMVAAVCAVMALGLAPKAAHADEGGVSFWVPGLYGSLATTPLQPGLLLAVTGYHTTVSAGGDVALAREISTGRIPVNLFARASANLDANANLVFVNPNYTFASPFLGGQATIGMMGVFGRMDTGLQGVINGFLTTPLGPIPFSRSDSLFDSTTGFGDLYPQFNVRWNAGVHNWMVYATGDIPVGSYDSSRLANIGIGHGAVDGGFGYTYFNPQTGHEFSGVLGLTYNFINPSTQYQNGVDLHFDWGASQFLSKTFMVGLVGYVYKEIGCDSGAGDRVGCFQSQVLGVGPQMGFIFPVGDMQGYLNVKAYKEFAGQNRPDGWNAWVTFVISPAAPPPATPRHLVSK
jgi:hypothetical protein